MKVILLFVDGLGLSGPDVPDSPVCPSVCPTLSRLLAAARPIDAGLGVPGLPQSATGQTTLLTGVNAAKAVGRHVEGFPTAALREIIQDHSIFQQLLDAGQTCTFANAYYLPGLIKRRRRLHSVTTVATLGAFGRVRSEQDLEEGRAVYQDITREALVARGYRGDLCTPAEAAGHLVSVANDHAFTLFEYFQTDRAGHSCDRKRCGDVLGVLDAFVDALVRLIPPAGLSLVLTSDHGNIEDLTRPTHTANPVPLVTVGDALSRQLAAVESLTDVTPALVELLTSQCG